MEVKFDVAGWTVTVLGDNEVSDVLAFSVGVVVVFAIEKHHDIGVPLDGTGFTEVGEHWALVRALLHSCLLYTSPSPRDS